MHSHRFFKKNAKVLQDSCVVPSRLVSNPCRWHSSRLQPRLCYSLIMVVWFNNHYSLIRLYTKCNINHRRTVKHHANIAASYPNVSSMTQRSPVHECLLHLSLPLVRDTIKCAGVSGAHTVTSSSWPLDPLAAVWPSCWNVDSLETIVCSGVWQTIPGLITLLVQGVLENFGWKSVRRKVALKSGFWLSLNPVREHRFVSSMFMVDTICFRSHTSCCCGCRHAPVAIVAVLVE